MANKPDIATPPEEDESARPAYDALTKKERRMVDEYLTNGMVQWKAYRDTIGRSIKPTVARVESSKRFANPNIKAAIDERLAEEAMSATEALHRLAEQARADQMAYLDERGSIDLAQLIEDGKAHLVKEIDFKGKDADRMVIRFNDAQAALDKILKAHGAYGAKGTAEDPEHHLVTINIVNEQRTDDG